MAPLARARAAAGWLSCGSAPPRFGEVAARRNLRRAASLALVVRLMLQLPERMPPPPGLGGSRRTRRRRAMRVRAQRLLKLTAVALAEHVAKVMAPGGGWYCRPDSEGVGQYVVPEKQRNEEKEDGRVFFVTAVDSCDLAAGGACSGTCRGSGGEEEREEGKGEDEEEKLKDEVEEEQYAHGSSTTTALPCSPPSASFPPAPWGPLAFLEGEGMLAVMPLAPGVSNSVG